MCDYAIISPWYNWLNTNTEEEEGEEYDRDEDGEREADNSRSVIAVLGNYCNHVAGDG